MCSELGKGSASVTAEQERKLQEMAALLARIARGVSAAEALALSNAINAVYTDYRRLRAADARAQQ